MVAIISCQVFDIRWPEQIRSRMSRNDRMRERSFGSFRTRFDALCLSRPRLARGDENDWYENWDMAVLMNRIEGEESRHKAFLDVFSFRLNDRKSGES